MSSREHRRTSLCLDCGTKVSRRKYMRCTSCAMKKLWREGVLTGKEQRDGFCRKGHDTKVVGRDNRGHCYICRREQDRIRDQKPERKEKTRQAIARWAERNPKKVRDSQKRWHQQNPDRVKRTQRQYYYRNKGARLANARKWIEEHPEARSNYNAKARIARTPPIPLALLDNMLGYYGRQCVYCGGDFQELDHLSPLSVRGTHTIDNLAPSCRSCNRSKHAHPIWIMLERALVS